MQIRMRMAFLQFPARKTPTTDTETLCASLKVPFPGTQLLRMVQGILVRSSRRRHVPARVPCRESSLPVLNSGFAQKLGFAMLDSVLVALKPQSDHSIYLAALRRMSPQQRLARAFELSDNARQLFRDGLRRRFPDLSEEELQQLYLNRLALCHNRNY